MVIRELTKNGETANVLATLDKSTAYTVKLEVCPSKETANLYILIFVPAVSRCCSALAVKALKPMNTSQYADQKKPRSHILILLAMTALLVSGGFLLWGRCGFVLMGCLAGYGAALRKAYKALEGMNGDISGYALSIAELCAVAVYALI